MLKVEVLEENCRIIIDLIVGCLLLLDSCFSGLFELNPVGIEVTNSTMCLMKEIERFGDEIELKNSLDAPKQCARNRPQ